MDEWKKIDKAVEAVQKEYDQLFAIEFVDMKNPKSHSSGSAARITARIGKLGASA